MSVVINSNITASLAANNLAYSNQMLQESLTKLSSGSKIVSPADDPGGLAVSMKLSATANRDGDLENNVSDATSLLQTQDGALQVAGSILDRVSQLETLYQDPTKNSSDLANYDDEFTQLQSELTSLTSESFNGVSLFSTGTSLTVYTTEDLSSTSAISVSAPRPASARSTRPVSPACPTSRCRTSPARSKTSRPCAQSTARSRAASASPTRCSPRTRLTSSPP